MHELTKTEAEELIELVAGCGEEMLRNQEALQRLIDAVQEGHRGLVEEVNQKLGEQNSLLQSRLTQLTTTFEQKTVVSHTRLAAASQEATRSLGETGKMLAATFVERGQVLESEVKSQLGTVTAQIQALETQQNRQNASIQRALDHLQLTVLSIKQQQAEVFARNEAFEKKIGGRTLRMDLFFWLVIVTAGIAYLMRADLLKILKG